jgi:hypothetical protein
LTSVKIWPCCTDSDSVIQSKVRNILRRIFKPVCENYLGWRLRHKEEPNELTDGPDIVKCIKCKTLQWPGHVVRMDNARIQKKKRQKGKCHGRRPVGRPRVGRELLMEFGEHF